MNRPTVRLTVAAAGGVAAVAALATFLVVSSGGERGAPAGWAVPLIAGAGVGLLSWFLLASTGRGESRGASPVLVRCVSCGAEVLEDWRLCPYCGGSSERGMGQRAAPSSSELEV